ncbi:hypothetical protein CJF42_23085 [Pseudoalteromonas sp. NBT06-2]|uniref:DUF4097 family beta strand repeat-containing protein n=1 Tax=Pseudoalteromonas sp. NBT06-2 TaxID=2025950 RepID=UPI000BA623A5|nr:DUF4097 family beta strand repeat-containing protein [Pseudoalteromonas sp. NBT06-2]PAJ72089.1 hypothetical protein CJF42_23085 [Pseudoalteromonas sp. NBT06-2]
MTKKLIAIALLSISSTFAFAGEKIDEVLSVSSNGKVIIENQRGDVKIKGWNKSEIKVTGELDDKAVGYELKRSGNRTIFKVKMPKKIHSWNSGEGSNLVIHIPMKSNLDFEGVNVNVDIAEVEGGSDIETINGNISARKLSGKVNLTTVNGGIRSKELVGKIHYETVNGDIHDTDSQGRLRFDAVNGDIEAQTKAEDIRIENVNGEIELKTELIQRLEISTVNGELDLSIPRFSNNARVQIETVSGNVQLNLSKNASAKFEIESHAGGRIKNNLTNDKVNKPKYGPSSSLEFEMSGGKADIEIDTISGRISLNTL